MKSHIKSGQKQVSSPMTKQRGSLVKRLPRGKSLKENNKLRKLKLILISYYFKIRCANWHQVNVKEILIYTKLAETKNWLKANAKSGWHIIGYIKPKPSEIEYHNYPGDAFEDGLPRTSAVPNAFIGFRFKKESEAIMFKMILNEL